MGPFDLSQALGYGGNWKHPDVRRKQEEMVRIARANGLEVMAATFDSNPEDLRNQTTEWQALGVRMFAVSGDRFMLSSGYKSIVSALSPLRATGQGKVVAAAKVKAAGGRG
jgi:4-hydroxy-2-oxoheptanedioate aldolase